MGLSNKLSSLRSMVRHNNRIAKDAVDENLFFAPLSRKISPSLIEERKKMIKFNDRVFTQTFLVGVLNNGKDGYPREIEENIISHLTELDTYGCTITYSVSVQKMPLGKASRSLQRAITANEAGQIASSKSNILGNVDLDLTFDHEDLVQNSRVLHNRDQNIFHTVFTIIISADTEEALRVTVGRVIQRLDSNNIKGDIPFGEQLNVWKNAMPFPGYYKKGSVEMFSTEVAKIVPARTPGNIMDPVGLLFGIDRKTKKEIIINLSKLIANHLLLVGPTGSGKTLTMLMLLMRAHDQLSRRIFFITDKDEKGTDEEGTKTDLKSAPDYYDGAYIKIGPGEGQLNINPFQILFDTSLMKSDYDYVQAYNRQKGLVIKFFNIWFLDDAHRSRNQNSKIDMYLDILYENAGIYRDNPVTWINATWPTMNDMWDLTEKHMDHDVTAKAIHEKIYQLCGNGEHAYINNPTNIDLSKSFTVIDMSGLPEDLKVPMTAIVIGILGLRFRTDSNQKTIIAVDEAGSAMRNPELVNYLLTLLIKGRSFDIALWLATQQPSDIEKAGVSSEFKTNMVINIILGKNLNKSSISIVKNYINMNAEEASLVQSSNVGEGVMFFNNISIPVNFKPTKQELDLLTGITKTITANKNDDININPLLLQLGIENGFFASNWISGDASRYLSRNGFVQRRATNPVGRGTTTVWIKSDLMKGELVGTQSVDHYATVLMIAAHLTERKWSIDIHHMHTADILAEYSGVKLSIEYERPGTHGPQDLRKKAQAIINEDRTGLFVAQSDNFNQVRGAVGDLKVAAGEDGVVKRGSMLINHIDKLMNQ